ncbi:Arylsulfatase [Pontiella desulfatans]|uniref:Arylsulfatase n=1 Tax=Pontiella desulfatans TaxID=2750659 RepID=A0A6C2TZC6_PONDE|nr:sulfatase [Pontiella desulfatans]SPS73679.1 sulfatase S1_16 [Kiritimatiellales bacterium]VGO12536.1 Arylsulfatase [Pontiella desulfatans]
MRMITKHSILLGLWVSIAAVQGKTPNVVFILADDLGITDIAAYASHFTGKPIDELYYETPHMDRLVGKGVAFSQFYANQLCAPTRAALMTGQYAARHGFTTATPLLPTYYNQGMPAPEGFNPHDVLGHKDNINKQQAWTNGRTNTALDPSLQTLPKVLGGHRSAFIGKWHLGGHGAKGFQPLDQGFDEAPAWFDAGGSAYFKWAKHWDKKRLPYPEMPQKESHMGSAGSAPHAAYLTDDLTDRAVRYIESAVADRKAGKDKRPFFLYFNHFAVHTPLQAPAETVAYFKNKPQKGTLGHNNATYAAMVKHLDDSVGRLIQALEAGGVMEDTLLVLTSDNGGVEYTNPAATDNFPFKGGKACLHEGGVRVPLVCWQPGRFGGGAWCDTPANCIDMLPTLAALTGNNIPGNVDGISIVPLLENPAAKMSPRTFYWHYPFNVIVNHPDNGLPLTPHSAIRVGDHKLLWDWHGKMVLYDIRNDPYEETDLAEGMPEKRDQLMKQLQAWLKDHVAPRYLPVRNPNYDAEKDDRKYPLVDLTGALK